MREMATVCRARLRPAELSKAASQLILTSARAADPTEFKPREVLRADRGETYRLRMSDVQAYGEPEPRPAAGWYPLNGERRYWDGQVWTEHRQALVPAPTTQPPTQAMAAYGYPVQQQRGYTTVMTNSRTNGVEVAIAWVITILSIGYMLPWAIAATRGKSNSWAIGLLNFLLGGRSSAGSPPWSWHAWLTRRSRTAATRPGSPTGPGGRRVVDRVGAAR